MTSNGNTPPAPEGVLTEDILPEPEVSASLLATIEALRAQLDQLTFQLKESNRLAEQRHREAIQEERNRLAREIHDTLAQSFTGILIQLGVALRISHQQPEEAWDLIKRVSELAQQGMVEARRSVWSLQYKSEKDVDLVQMLELVVAHLREDTTLAIDMEVQGTPRSLPNEIGVQLLRISQEALSNAIHHANATNIVLTLTFEANQLTLSVQDNGQGFETHHLKENVGFGLIGMRQRTERIAGKIEIQSERGNGTTIRVMVPLVLMKAEEVINL